MSRLNLDEQFEKVFNSFTKSELKKNYAMDSKSLTESVIAGESRASGMEAHHLEIEPSHEYELQRKIRPLFNKEGVNTSRIGIPYQLVGLGYDDEPLKNHYACTFFFDIKGSTRLSLLYDLEQVFTFKNSIIQVCIEIIRALDGHVHRIMGDAVMAFFIGNGKSKENSIADAINCATTIKYVIEDKLKPWLEEQGFESQDIGFRIGCDFGDNHEIIWGGFGYSNVGEISAAGLPVDMASKLQNRSSKNNAMLGQNLIDYINWPDLYSKFKTIQINGQTQIEEIVIPNITNRYKEPLDYKMKLLNFDKYIELSPLPSEYREKQSRNIINNNSIKFKCEYFDGENWIEYISASMFLDKKLDLKFTVSASTRGALKFPLEIIFSKTNHGPETPENERDIKKISETKVLTLKRTSQYNSSVPLYAHTSIDEMTEYRGLHTMECEIKDSSKAVIYREIIGVLIK
ncbi:hypothetical protein AAGU50_09560 [Aeromonas dhakensis]|uniref:nucleotide-binding domain-containing protein n=1 Tax=Aeromonas dhakensis TaxID=196024 RepID=UPI003F8700AD